MKAVRLELLQQMPLFGAIRDDALAALLEPSIETCVERGQYFFREGEPAQAMYVLECGRVSVLRLWQGHELVLGTLGVGQCFGEMALLDLAPRSASVRADVDCAAIELRPEHLLALFERDAEQFALIQMNLAREMSRRLRITDDLLFRARMGEPADAPPLDCRAA